MNIYVERETFNNVVTFNQYVEYEKRIRVYGLSEQYFPIFWLIQS